MNATGRRDLMNKLADLIEKNKAKLSEIESLDNGKPVGTGVFYGASIDLHLVVQCLRFALFLTLFFYVSSA